MSSFTVEAYLKAVGADKFASDMGKASDSVGKLPGSTKKAGGGIRGMMGSVTKLAGAIGITKLVAAGFGAIKNSVDDAVKRVDTLNQFPRVLQNMGYATEDTEASIARLSDGIQGLPTRLDEVASTTQRMVTVFGDVDLATESTLALNNAFIASGSSQADANRGMEQYIQMLSTGKVDMQSWRTLQETMPYALQETAESFGFAGESAQNDFYDALQSGEITMDEMNAKMIELSEETGGFAEVALTASKGIGTSFQNIKTAIVTGLGNAISEVDRVMQEKGFGSIDENLDKVKERIQVTFSNMVEGIEPFVDALIVLYDTITESVAFQILTDVVELAREKFAELIEKVKEFDFVQLGEDILAFVDTWLPLIAGIGGAVGAYALWNAALVIGNGIMVITAGVMTALSTAGTILGGVIAFLTSPFGLVIIAIGLVIAIGVALWQNWDTIREKATELGNKVSATWENLRTATSEKFNAIKTAMTNKVEQAKTAVSNKVEQIKSTMTNKFEQARANVVEKFEGIRSGMNEKMEAGKRIVTNAVEAIKGFFNIDLAASGKAMINSVWDGVNAAKDAVIGKISGVAGNIRDLWPFSPAKEGPLSDIHKMDFASPIGQSIDNARKPIMKSMEGLAGVANDSFNPTMAINGNIARSNGQIQSAVSHEIKNSGNSRMENILNKLAEGQYIVLDSGELVGATYPQYDRVGGSQTQLTERWGR